MKNRTVMDGEVHHICQKTRGGAVIFYTMADYLVFFTIVCTLAEKEGVSILALCPMPDHTHQACRVADQRQMSSFVMQYTHLFALEWNRSRGRKGALFQARFGSSAKRSNKEVRTSINYNNNNPVERKICRKAEDYRWNFLKYAKSSSPYSKPLDEAWASAAMRRALKGVRRCHAEGKWIRYDQLDAWSRKLSGEEKEQLADYIICQWNVIDYAQAISFYGDYDAMIRSFHDNTGSEYEIHEDRDPYSDAVYFECTRLLLREKQIENIRDIPKLSGIEKSRLYRLIQRRTTARPKQIYKYLHWDGTI